MRSKQSDGGRQRAADNGQTPADGRSRFERIAGLIGIAVFILAISLTLWTGCKRQTVKSPPEYPMHYPLPKGVILDEFGMIRGTKQFFVDESATARAIPIAPQEWDFAGPDPITSFDPD